MRKSRGLNFDDGAAWRAHALGALRPSVEAALLAGVALGCAQIGWEAMAPQRADASDHATLTGSALDETPVLSPFAATATGTSSARGAALEGISLAGVRMSVDAAKSGAFFTLADGSERAFGVGQEIEPGVKLAEVHPDHIVLAYQGGERRVGFAKARSETSLALALMGKAGASGAGVGAPSTVAALAPKPSASPVGAPTRQPLTALDAPGATSPFAASSPAASSETGRWLDGALTQVEVKDGRPFGWRVSAPLPAAAAELGLKAGDVVLSVNGSGPDDPSGALRALAGGPITLEVEHLDGGRSSVTVPGAPPRAAEAVPAAPAMVAELGLPQSPQTLAGAAS